MRSRKVTIFFILILCIIINKQAFCSTMDIIKCPHGASLNQKDDDEDDIGNLCDNCWEISNPDQLDSNENCPEQPYNFDPACGDACEIIDTDSIVKKIILLKFLLQSK